MKLKCIPEDFVVTELADRTPSEGGFGLYRLTKRSIGTPEALQILRRSWNLPAGRISHGGMKDRHAVTTQFVTIRSGPKAPFEHKLFRLDYLGPTPKAFAAADISGNRFEIAVRSLSEDDCRLAIQKAEQTAQTGFPNYFDEQRFGSLGPSQEFVAAKWCLKDYERALWLALAEHNRHDDADERGQKQILRDHWNNWAECKSLLNRSHRRSVVTYLVDHPDGFRKAFGLLNSDLRGIFLSAFQSAVWNRMTALKIDQSVSGSQSPEICPSAKIGDAELPFPDLSAVTPSQPLDLPLPSARCKGLTEELSELCRQALAPYDMTLSQMKLSFPRDRWFSRGLRRCIVMPNNLQCSEGDDERYAGRRKVTLTFDLPRGSYATMLIKTLFDTSDRNPGRHQA